jgi:hypothetical protein
MDELEAIKAKRNALRREEYRLDGEQRRADNRAWKEANREQVRAAGREYQRLRRLSDPERECLRERAWRAANKDKVREYNKRSRAGKFDQAYNTAWQAKNRAKFPIKYALRNCKNRAKLLGVAFNLTAEDIVVPEFCPVLGIKLEWGHSKNNGFFASNTPSLDRRDPKKGYVKGNVFVMSNRANILKRDGTLAEFRKLVAYMERNG